MIVIIKYRAVKSDNHQGGSGMPFEDKIISTIPDSMTASGIDCHCNHLLKCAESPLGSNINVEKVDMISIELVSEVAR